MEDRVGGRGFCVSTQKLHKPQWSTLKFQNIKKIVLANVYRQPKGNATNAIENLLKCLEIVKQSHKGEIIILWDFNINFANTKDNNVKQLKSAMESYGLVQLIKDHTRHAKHVKTTIDLIFTNINYVYSAGVKGINIPYTLVR